MFLKKIEIAGFKSFAQKTILEFDKEISAVVGPNGSGKSNVADAVRWAIGEQSTKALRVKKSENLIFSGHATSVGRASVSLYFDNTDRALPIDFEELVITRRLHKNGDTEYFINKSKVRLLDILEMLSRIGINPKSYCVVSQGMADAILRATAEERRGLFEDAAGVKPYKIKKNEAARKLDLTEQNLSRVRDLLAEISPRLAFLRRQANKAQKLSVVKSELDDFLKRWYSYNLNRLDKQKKDFAGRVAEIDGRIDGAKKNLNAALAKMNKIKEQSGSVDAKQESLRNDLERIQVRIDENIKKLAVAETKLKIEQEREIKPEAQAVAISLGYIKAKVSELYQSIIAVLEKIKKARENVGVRDEAEKNLVAVERNVRDLLEEVISGKVSIGKNSNNQQIRRLAEERKKILGQLQREAGVFKKELDGLYSQKDATRKLIDEEVTGDKARRGEFFALQEEINRAEEAVNKIRIEKQSIIINQTRIDTRVEDLISEIKVELAGAAPEEIIKLNIETLDEGEAKAKIDKLRREYIQIGGIDPAVIGECRETEERFGFLAKESEDLEKAMIDLRKIISQLDEKIEEQFNAIFKKINFEFNKYFRSIFGGGGASLEIFELASEENGEEAAANEGEEEEKIKKKRRDKGINVKVNIPGKKIKDLEMLSGGERSLASSAILFAIISSNPPPFVVVDEIDAALDESNSQKIAEIISQLSVQTQFIVVTHNRAMMRQAKTIYGVSMTDDSISKIISVKFDEVK